jgi:hypothetical protein
MFTEEAIPDGGITRFWYIFIPKAKTEEANLKHLEHLRQLEGRDGK